MSIKMIKEHTDENNILVRMFWNNMSKTHPITVQALDDDCGEIIEAIKCPSIELAEKHYNRYLYGENTTVSMAV